MDIPTNNWTQIGIEAGDITIVKITGDWGTLTLFNIYNDCEHDNMIELVKNLQKRLDDHKQDTPNENAHTIWLGSLGDFNRHHPHWDDTSDSRLFTTITINKVKKLISAVADAGLDLALPPKMLGSRALTKWLGNFVTVTVTFTYVTHCD